MYGIFFVLVFCEIEDFIKLEEVKILEQFFWILVNENILIKLDVVVMQFVFKQINCEELEKKCVEYV